MLSLPLPEPFRCCRVDVLMDGIVDILRDDETERYDNIDVLMYDLGETRGDNGDDGNENALELMPS